MATLSLLRLRLRVVAGLALFETGCLAAEGGGVCLAVAAVLVLDACGENFCGVFLGTDFFAGCLGVGFVFALVVISVFTSVLTLVFVLAVVERDFDVAVDLRVVA